MVRRIASVILLFLGIVLGGWVAFNLLVHMTPSARGRNLIPAICASAAFIYVGIKWMRGMVAQ
jgi:hypothetical protein